MWVYSWVSIKTTLWISLPQSGSSWAFVKYLWKLHQEWKLREVGEGSWWKWEKLPSLQSSGTRHLCLSQKGTSSFGANFTRFNREKNHTFIFHILKIVYWSVKDLPHSLNIINVQFSDLSLSEHTMSGNREMPASLKPASRLLPFTTLTLLLQQWPLFWLPPLDLFSLCLNFT